MWYMISKKYGQVSSCPWILLCIHAVFKILHLLLHFWPFHLKIYNNHPTHRKTVSYFHVMWSCKPTDSILSIEVTQNEGHAPKTPQLWYPKYCWSITVLDRHKCSVDIVPIGLDIYVWSHGQIQQAHKGLYGRPDQSKLYSVAQHQGAQIWLKGSGNN